MARRKNLSDEKVEEIKQILVKYNGIPSQKENKNAYASVSYIFKSYATDPRIIILREQFSVKQRQKKNYEERYSETLELLDRFKGMPPSKEENTLYNKVRRFFTDYGNTSEVQLLMYKYAYSAVYPLKNTAYGPQPTNAWDSFNGPYPIWLKWRRNVSFEFIEYTYERFKILPADETKPMQELWTVANHFYRYNLDCHKDTRDQLFSLSKKLIDLGCSDEKIQELYYSFVFCEEEAQKRVRNLLIENGACTIYYISQTAIPGHPISPKFVLYYYYCLHHDNGNFWDIVPLGHLHPAASDEDYYHIYQQIIYCNYRDYKFCDIDKIRNETQRKYRDWEENPPQNLDDWKYYGRLWFFDIKYDYYTHSSNHYTNLSINWDSTRIDKAFEKGQPYFSYRPPFKYTDYYIFLIENNIPINKEYRQFKELVLAIKNGRFVLHGKYEECPEIIYYREKLKELLKESGIES